MRRVHALAAGEVQGVGYRYTMKRVADEAGASGWVRNLSDGRVEAEVEGTPSQVDAVLEWMARGPRGGRVAGLQVTDLPVIGGTGFEVRRDS